MAKETEKNFPVKLVVQRKDDGDGGFFFVAQEKLQGLDIVDEVEWVGLYGITEVVKVENRTRLVK